MVSKRISLYGSIIIIVVNIVIITKSFNLKPIIMPLIQLIPN